MVSYKNNTSLSIAGALAAFLNITSTSTADRVFLTNKAEATDIYPGCPVDIGFRVQYSDLAQLKWVQLQVLGADNSLMIEGLDNSTRAQWDNTRTKIVTWTVPNNWPSGDYIVRAFGNASYPCQHGTRRERCDFVLEDRETFHLHPLAASQGCPLSSLKPSTSSPSTIETPTTTAHNTINKEGTALPSSGNSAESYNKSSQDLLSKNLAVEMNTPSTLTTTNGNSNDNDISNSNLVQKTVDQSITQRIQDQTILKVLDETRDYNIQKSTLTLKSGNVIPISDRMDSSTIARFIQTLELSNSALRSSQNGGKGGVGVGIGSIELIAALHKNSSLIVIPPVSPSSNTAITSPVTTIAPFNHTEINPFGRGFIQDDQNQIQDKKSNDASCRTAGMTTITTVQGLFATALAAVIGVMAL